MVTLILRTKPYGLGKPYSKAQRKLAETVIIHHPQRQKAVTEPCR